MNVRWALLLENCKLSHGLVCPDCQQPLVQIPLHSRLSHVCPMRHGKAFPTSTIRKWVKREQLQAFDLCLSRMRPGKRSCVRCRTPMSIVALNKGFEIDRCNSCELLWFDKVEFEAVPKKSIEEIEREESGIEFTVEEGFVLNHSPWDDPDMSKKRFPWITVLIIVFCSALTHMVQTDDWKLFVFDPEHPLRYFGAPLFFSIFSHIDMGHLINNMIFLFTHGSMLEEAVGEENFLKIFFLCGISGTLVQGILMPGSLSLGASGALAGVFAFLAITRPELKKIKIKRAWFFPYSFSVFSLTLKIPIRIAFLLWILPQIAGVYLQARGGANIGYLAHLGGALMGIYLTTSAEFRIMKPAKNEQG